MNINMHQFKNILKMTQSELKNYLVKKLETAGREVEVGDGYIYSPGELPIIVCAHLDTVHETVPYEIICKNGVMSSPQGIGGDDRCGVYMILEIIKQVNPHVIFFEDEETGGKGSMKFTYMKTCEKLCGKINYVIELDRKNANDAVFYDLDNTEFIDFVTETYWKEAFGSFTDICNICPELECAGVNLSCGYYNQHTKTEYIVIKEMMSSIKETINLIKRSPDKLFEYVEFVYSNNLWKNNGYYEKGYCESVYTILFVNDLGAEDEYIVEALSETEALGMFMIDKPDRCFNDIIEIY